MNRPQRCDTCQGSGWVCEAHPDKPSVVTTTNGCACGAPAENCDCNPDGEAKFAVVYASVERETMQVGESNSGGTDLLMNGVVVARAIHGPLSPRRTAEESHRLAVQIANLWNSGQEVWNAK